MSKYEFKEAGQSGYESNKSDWSTRFREMGYPLVRIVNQSSHRTAQCAFLPIANHTPVAFDPYLSGITVPSDGIVGSDLGRALQTMWLFRGILGETERAEWTAHRQPTAMQARMWAWIVYFLMVDEFSDPLRDKLADILCKSKDKPAKDKPAIAEKSGTRSYIQRHPGGTGQPFRTATREQITTNQSLSAADWMYSQYEEMVHHNRGTRPRSLQLLGCIPPYDLSSLPKPWGVKVRLDVGLQGSMESFDQKWEKCPQNRPTIRCTDAQVSMWQAMSATVLQAVSERRNTMATITTSMSKAGIDVEPLPAELDTQYNAIHLVNLRELVDAQSRLLNSLTPDAGIVPPSPMDTKLENMRIAGLKELTGHGHHTSDTKRFIALYFDAKLGQPMNLEETSFEYTSYEDRKRAETARQDGLQRRYRQLLGEYASQQLNRQDTDFALSVFESPMQNVCGSCQQSRCICGPRRSQWHQWPQ